MAGAGQYTPRRDLVGYAGKPPNANWPGGARIALNFVFNYEEGAEYSIQEGHGHAESILSEQSYSPPAQGRRNRNMESMYEYGSRVGIWRLLDLFRSREIAPTANIVGRAVELNPAVGAAIAHVGCDIVGHGWQWIDYEDMAADQEAQHIARTVDTIEKYTGVRPLGWYTGRPSLNTRRLAVQHGGFLYDCDDYNEELPYWVDVDGQNHLVVPHSFDTNDSRFARGSGIETSDQFFSYLKDSFDWLYQEGETAPKMMTVSLHCRLVGHPGRMAGIARFIDHVRQHDKVWICQKSDIAKHWIAHHGAT